MSVLDNPCSAGPLPNGVYCDHSGQNPAAFAIVVLVGEKSVKSFTGTLDADERCYETAVVRIAKILFPDQRIFCGRAATVKKEGVEYVYRKRNPAHGASQTARTFYKKERLAAGEAHADAAANPLAKKGSAYVSQF